MNRLDYSLHENVVSLGFSLLCTLVLTVLIRIFLKSNNSRLGQCDYDLKPLNVGIVGAGAIGTFAGMRMLESPLINNVLLIGRESLMKSLEKNKNIITLEDNTKGCQEKALLIGEKFNVICDGNLESLRKCDVIILSVKSNVTQDVGESIARILPPNSSASIFSFQNGTKNPEKLRMIFASNHPNVNIVASVVAFAAEWEADSTTFALNFPGGCIFEKPRGNRQTQQQIDVIIKALNTGGLKSKQITHIKSIMYAKLLVNLINPVNALSGVTVPKMFAQRGYRLVLAAAIKEAVAALKSSGVEAGTSLQVRGIGFLLPLLLRILPDCAFRFAFERKFIGENYKSSMLQDLERGRKSTEIDDLCGEIIRLAPYNSPVNKALLQSINETQRSNNYFTADELLMRVGLT